MAIIDGLEQFDELQILGGASNALGLPQQESGQIQLIGLLLEVDFAAENHLLGAMLRKLTSFIE